MSRKFIRAVLFDFGGTLMYGQRNWVSVFGKADDKLTEYLRANGLDVHPHTFSLEFRRNLDTYFKQREKDLMETTYTFVLRELLKDKGYDAVTNDIIQNALKALFSITQENWKLEEDAIPTLKELKEKGYNLGIVSNAGDDQDVQQLARNFGITDYFDFILTSAACSYRKPHPRIYEIALSNWYYHPQEAVMVGDNLFADIHGAQKADIYGIWISRRADHSMKIPESVQPNASISSLSELSSALDHLQVS